jgi:hypothetical protein
VLSAAHPGTPRTPAALSHVSVLFFKIFLFGSTGRWAFVNCNILLLVCTRMRVYCLIWSPRDFLFPFFFIKDLPLGSDCHPWFPVSLISHIAESSLILAVDFNTLETIGFSIKGKLGQNQLIGDLCFPRPMGSMF